MQSIHEPVLLHEIIECVIPAKAGIQEKSEKVNANLLDSRLRGNDNQQNGNGNKKTFWYLDGTLGGAGHALAIAKKLSGKLNIIGLDRDMEAIERAKVTLKGKSSKLILECENFRNLDKVIAKHQVELRISGEKNRITGKKDGITGIDFILLDLGISSDELDNSGRGFTFQKDEPLLMTMGDPKNYPFTAKDIVNSWDESVIADIIYGYAEERFGRKIARAIVNYRAKKQIETSGELAEIVKMSVPGFYKRDPTSSAGSGLRKASKIHPATRTFQALRIAVNDELNSLREGLAKGYESLNKGGRMAIISFHSLEDRIVKDFNKKMLLEDGAKIITKKPIVASAQEIAENPRSRSAKLRILEK